MPGRKLNHHRIALEESTGLSKRQVNRRIKEGTATEDHENHKTRKEKATADLRERQAERARLEVEKMKGILVERAEMQARATKVGAIHSAVVNAARNNWPSKLAGLNEVEIRQRLDTEFDQMQDQFLAELHKITK